MRKTLRHVGLLPTLLAVLFAPSLHAQDIAGNWQGTLKSGPQSLRLILQVAKPDSGGWSASLMSIDQGGFDNRFPANIATLKDSVLTMVFDGIQARYEGKLVAGGTSIRGSWTQNNGPQPLDFQRPTSETAWRDPSPHSVRFITVAKNVKLEVLDWGGTGRPIVLLSGLGNSGHVFDQFALKLTSDYHVYGISRRGFGASSVPASGYTADRLGDDVLAVVDSLGLNRPVLVGHSIAGEELSSVGSRHPEKVAGLVYLDAGYAYAFYDRARGNLLIDVSELQHKLEKLWPTSGAGSRATKQAIQELLDTDLPAVAKDLRETQKTLEASPDQPAAATPMPFAGVYQAIMTGEQKYTSIPAPVLAIYALPHQMPPGLGSDAARAAAVADSATAAQANAFEKGVPSARVVRLPNANHYVFLSNEADVLREMRAFINGLPAAPK